MIVTEVDPCAIEAVMDGFVMAMDQACEEGDIFVTDWL